MWHHQVVSLATNTPGGFLVRLFKLLTVTEFVQKMDLLRETAKRFLEVSNINQCRKELAAGTLWIVVWDTSIVKVFL